MSNEERLRSLLSDLGKATLRGVRKCPKCGTYNGSRGLCCKNKYCDAVFKEPGERRKLSTEACKLITGSTAQVFSVRVRDKGPDYRGFVQLPLINASVSHEITTLISQTTALCFVDSCERSFDTSVLKCHEEDITDLTVPTCQHIQAALRCYAEAQPLTLRNSILSSLNVNNEIKQEIWLLATETSGPLVQRVSKNIMAVKCKASPKHPLGYLHFSFYVTKLKDRTEHRYLCSCTAFKAPMKVIGDKIENQSVPVQRCAHFYACVCAFASDPKLSAEFDYYINLDQSDLRVQKLIGNTYQSNESDKIIGMELENLTPDDNDTQLLIFRDDTLAVQSLDAGRLDIDSMNLEPSILPTSIVGSIDVECDRALLDDNSIISQIHNSEVMDQRVVLESNNVKILDDQSEIEAKYNILNSGDYLLDENNIKVLNSGSVKVLEGQTILEANNLKLLQSSGIMDACGIKIIEKSTLLPCNCGVAQQAEHSSVAAASSSSSKRKRDEKLGSTTNSTSINNLNSIETRKARTKPPTILKKYTNAMETLDEANASLSFIKWLASITERINQTMHFQFDGKPDPLVFHVPQIFFDCLRERISCGGKKKRLPNSTTAFVRKDGVPLGTFTKYTWQITNILHVKSIFETPLIPLEITRSFVQNSDGTYELYKREETEIDRFKKTGNKALIKPLELKTYLKVGNTSPNQIEPTPFLIEWIPDILPVSKIGELRIRFEFGHVKNETPQRWRKLALSKNY